MIIKVCMWKTCQDRFSEYILTRLKADVDFYKKNDIEIEECMCLGQCKKWPNIVKGWEILNYITPAKASELIFKPKHNKKK